MFNLRDYDEELLRAKERKLITELKNVQRMLSIERLSQQLVMPERLRVWFLQQRPEFVRGSLDNHTNNKDFSFSQLTIGETVVTLNGQYIDHEARAEVCCAGQVLVDLSNVCSEMIVQDAETVAEFYKHDDVLCKVVENLRQIGDANETESAWNNLTLLVKPSIAICLVYACFVAV